MATLSPTFTEHPARSTNPRRCPPTTSVSLPTHKKQKIGHPSGPDDGILTAGRVADLRHSSSGESSSETSGSKWYDNANMTVTQSWQDAEDYNTEPPFFMSHQPHHDLQNQSPSASEHSFGVVPRDESENEDLRGVIDDLTIENKRLKQMLRTHKGRRLPKAHDGDELFEVRMHGLPPERKRELEALLKNFASSMQNARSTIRSAKGTANSGNPPSTALGAIGVSTEANKKRLPTDSGYGSNSGQPSTAPSTGDRSVQPTSHTNRDMTVKTYLHDIPDTLLPRMPPAMSQRSKMALIVRKLEQLFTGKSAVPGEHSQPLQQQEISQSAARADRQEDKKNDRRRQAEGTREAHILPYSADNLDASEHETSPKKIEANKATFDSSDRSTLENNSHLPNRLMSPDQRPTRPLDLDIERQVTVAENIDYIRHLGLSTPHINNPNAASSGWMYLNLLINMAQLHSINVTPDFIRRAIRERSTKFELSEDGNRVRWVGGPDGTVFSSDEERVLEAVNTSTPIAMDGVLTTSGGSKRSKPGSSNAFTSPTPSEDTESPRIIRKPMARLASAFDYKPILFSGKSSALANDSSAGSFDSCEDQSGSDSGRLVKALSRSQLGQRHGDDGLITFYKNPFFCSDFSGDKRPLNRKQGIFDDESAIVGASPKVEDGETALRYHNACYFTPQFAARGFDVPEEDIPSFSPSPVSSAGQCETLPIDLPASGLGGVMPEDNFAIDVKVERADVPPSRRYSRNQPLTRRRTMPRFEYHVLERQRIELRPSELPLPSYAMFTSSSSGAVDTMDVFDESDSGSSGDEEAILAPSFMGQFSPESSMNRGTSDDSDEADESEDESVDMLGAARAVDPEMVAAQERDFFINQAGGGAKVPGSLAVTVGTGSCGSSSDGGGIWSDVDERGSVQDADDSDDDDDDDEME